jgi:hypothetical protein
MTNTLGSGGAKLVAAERIEAEAVLDLIRRLPPDLGARYAGRAVDLADRGVAISLGRLDVPMLNRAFALGLGGGVDLHDTLDRLLDVAGGVPFLVQLTPAADTEQVRQGLEGRGLQPMDNWVKVHRGSQPPPA